MDSEIKTLLEQQGDAFEAFAAKHNAALAAERKEREALELRLSRSGRSADDREAKAEPERKALGLFVRDGDDTEIKAMSAGIDPAGGYTVMDTMANTIRTKVRSLSPVAMLARRVVLTKGDGFSEPYDTSDMSATWAGETQSRDAETTPVLAMLNVPLHELTTNQTVTQKLLDVSNYDLGAWLEGRIGDKFARSIGAAVVTGSGIARPRGYTTYTTSTAGDSTRTDGQLQHIATGVSGDFAASAKGDKLIDMVYTLRAPFRANACFMMNSTTAGLVRKFKDGQGNYLWADSMQAGQPSRLLGYPCYLDEELPDIGANTYSIAFGDFGQGYLMVEQPGIKLLRDPFSSKPNVQFYAYQRVGGGVADCDAIKLLKFGTS